MHLPSRSSYLHISPTLILKHLPIRLCTAPLYFLDHPKSRQFPFGKPMVHLIEGLLDVQTANLTSFAPVHPNWRFSHDDSQDRQIFTFVSKGVSTITSLFSYG